VAPELAELVSAASVASSAVVACKPLERRELKSDGSVVSPLSDCESNCARLVPVFAIPEIVDMTHTRTKLPELPSATNRRDTLSCLIVKDRLLPSAS
jgi:hypothetical protein